MNPLGAILKIRRGEMGLDELAEMMAAAGIDAQFNPVAVNDALPRFKHLAGMAQQSDASITSLELKLKGGQTLTGLLVVNHKQ
jgi:hypothetical protein